MEAIGLKRLDKPYRDGDIYDAVLDVMELSGMRDHLRSLGVGGKVLVKPNVVADLPADLGATTDPRVVLGICYALSDIGLTPLVAESSSIGVDTAYALSLEYGKVSDAGFQVVPLDGGETMELSHTGHGGIEIFRVVEDVAAIISVPKIKTHDQAVVSMGMKNLKGLLPDSSKARVHHLGLTEGIVELYGAIVRGLRTPVLSVVDGLVGMEGLGPVYGTPVDLGLILGGINTVDVDSLCCEIMGIDPMNVPYLSEALKRGFGGKVSYDSAVRGNAPLPAVMRKFQTASEALSELNLNGLTFDWDRACTGCKNTILSVLSEMRCKGEDISGFAFCSGRGCKGASEKDTVYVGNCAAHAGANGRAWARGCPPVNEELIAVIDGIRTKRI